MPSIRITSFGGINTEVSPRLSQDTIAQVAHNCLLWDGSLRPLAKWIRREGVEFEDVASIQISPDNNAILSSALLDAVFLHGPNYVPNTRVGLSPFYFSGEDANIVYANALTTIEGKAVGVHRPNLLNTSSVSYSRQYHSEKPVNRLYAVSAIRRSGDKIEESPLSLLPNQSTRGIIYEGDSASITINATSSVPYAYTGMRLYRSISGMDTGAATTNELDTDWYLVAEFDGTADGINFNYSYVDGGSATNDPLDLYLAKDFYPPRRRVYNFLQQLEGGWIAVATSEGEIAISERYQYHAWPIENWYQLHGQVITDFKAQFDTLFIGTQNQPYMMTVAPGERLGVQAAITPFPEVYPCLPKTMDSTPTGAMYASPSGVVSLSREGQRLASAGVTSGVRPLHRIERQWDTTDAETGEVTHHTKFYPMRFQHTNYGAYFRGSYFGFCKIATGEIEDLQELFLFKGYIFNTGSSLDGERPLQRFVTFDTPNNVRAHTIGGSGLYVLATDGIWYMVFPDSTGDEAYAKAPKYCYTWRSKKYVFPGEMVMAAGKVDHDCKGFVRIKIIVDCCCVYETKVDDCKPFLLPPSIKGVTYEVEVEGTATVHEIHLASSLRELIEQ